MRKFQNVLLQKNEASVRVLIRLFDVLFSALVLIFFFPFFLVISVLVKLSSKGKIFFKQIRVGKDGKDFMLYKFRTMFVNAQQQGFLTVGERDARITSLGFFLRKYKLDEFPQFLNVLIGDMSLVGPRPEVRKYVNLYNEDQKQVLRIKPGITDYASIEFRNESEMLAEAPDPHQYYIESIMPRKIEINQYFLDHYGLKEYFNVIIRTQFSLADFRKFLIRNNITPKWSIFLIDLLVCIFSISYAGYLLSDNNFMNHQFPEGIALTACVSSFFFFILKPYDGIIRYSDVHEALKIFISVFFSFLSLMAINLMTHVIGQGIYFKFASLIVFFFVAFAIMFGYRLLIKLFYNLSVRNKAFTHVIICGAGINSSLFIKLIQQIINPQYKVIAFLENNKNLVGKTIDDVRVYNMENITALIKKVKAKIVYLATPDLDLLVNSKIISECLRSNVEVRQIPAFQQWMQGESKTNEQKIIMKELLDRKEIIFPNKQLHCLFKKRILITGAAGLIGTELARSLASAEPASLILCDNFETGLFNLEHELKHDYTLKNIVKVHLGDIKDRFSMSQLFLLYQPEIVIHAAAYTHGNILDRHPSESICNNVEGTKIIADLADFHQVERFLLISTEQNEESSDLLSASKRISELYCSALQNKSIATDGDPMVYNINSKKIRPKFIAARLCPVLSERNVVISQLNYQIENGGPLTIPHPEAAHHFITLKEACTFLLEALTNGNINDVFSIDAGPPVKTVDLAKKMIYQRGGGAGDHIKIHFSSFLKEETFFNASHTYEEELLPTNFKKLMKVKTRKCNYSWIMTNLDHLLKLAHIHDDEAVLKQIKKMAPAFSFPDHTVYRTLENEDSGDGFAQRV